MYEEDVIAGADLLLRQVPEVEDRVRERKKLLLDQNAYQRKFEASSAALENAQNRPAQGGGGNFLPGRRKSGLELVLPGRRKSGLELDGEVATRKMQLGQAEVATRKMQLGQAEQAAHKITEWCLVQFRALLDQRESGHVLSRSAERLERIHKLFPRAAGFDATLATYEVEFDKLQSGAGEKHLFSKYKTTAAPQQQKNDQVFGRALGPAVPRVVTEIVEYLDSNHLHVEGLFRISGNHDRVFELRERYNAGELDCLAHCDPHDAAALLKRFFLDLPESLVPAGYYNNVLEAMLQCEDPGEAMSEIMGSLPEPHFVCLSYVLQFLFRVARQSELNKMTSVNLSTCLAPTLLRAPEGQSPLSVMNDMKTIIQVLGMLIEEAQRYHLTGGQEQEHMQQREFEDESYEYEQDHLPMPPPMATSGYEYS
jgi:hypothetical protein